MARSSGYIMYRIETEMPLWAAQKCLENTVVYACFEYDGFVYIVHMGDGLNQEDDVKKPFEKNGYPSIEIVKVWP
jgi:hypothetical protein